MSEQNTNNITDAGVHIHPADAARTAEKKRNDFYYALRMAQAAQALAALYQIKAEDLPEPVLPFLAHLQVAGDTPLTLIGYDDFVLSVTAEEVRTKSDLTMRAALDIIMVAAANPAARAGGITPFGTEKDCALLTLAARHMGLSVNDGPSDEIIAKYEAEWNPFIVSFRPAMPSPRTAPAPEEKLTAKANARFRAAPVIDEALYQQGLDHIFHVAAQVREKDLAPQITVRDTAQALNIGEGKARALLDKIETHEDLIVRGPGRRRYVQSAPNP